MHQDLFRVSRRQKRTKVSASPDRYHAAIPPTLTPSSTAWSVTPTGSISTAKACGEPANPTERPEPVALWTCRYAWTTQERCPHAHSRSNRKTRPSSRDSRLTTRLRRCQKPDSQNASRPGRHQIGMVGEIKSVHPGEIIGISSRGRLGWRRSPRKCRPLASAPARTRLRAMSGRSCPNYQRAADPRKACAERTPAPTVTAMPI